MSLNEMFGARRAELGIDTTPVYVAPLVLFSGEQRDAAFMGKASSWATKALHGRAETLAGMQVGDGKNDYLNKSAFVLLRFALAGHLDAQEVVETLGAADGGLHYLATRSTLDSAMKGAQKHGPLDPPIDGPEGVDFFEAIVGQARAGVAPAEPASAAVDPFDIETGEVAGPAAPGAEGATEPVVEGPAESAIEALTLEELAERRHERAVAAELATLRARDEAKRIFTAERAALEFREPPSVLTLREQLLLPRDEVRFAIEDLLPQGGNALMTAQYKSGKTTFMANLLRAYADDQPFLGRYKVTPGPGRIAIFNYELSPAQFDTWLEQAGIINQERVSVLHLRGFRLPLTTPRVEDWIVGWLKEHDTSFWIADPFARAAVGVDENSNTEVGVWLDTFDVIKERAGVSEGVLPNHTGRAEQESGAERGRGATRLDDWADVRWIMTKDKDDNRYFRATGRDVEVPEEKLTYDEATRGYSIGGGDRRWVERRTKAQAILDYINSNPGCSGRQVQLGVGGNKDLVTSLRMDLIARHKIRIDKGSSTRGEMHFANDTEA